ncbi:MAG: hypothetical protein POELPBGB_00170 [Bacteroidia bacterium]|nr:hypothetical protein [Bacteroidia bacterium]
MNKILLTVSVLLFTVVSFAQTQQEFEIIMNGKKEKVSIGKQYKFITPKGDTVVYQLNNAPQKTISDQPKINDKAATSTTYKEPAASENKPAKTESLSDIERLKEEARQKLKGNAPATTTQTVAETKPADNKKVAAEKETKTTKTEKLKEPLKAEKKVAEAVLEKEEKKVAEVVPGKYDFKKYYVADQNINAANIASQDTLKFVATDLSVYKDFPSLQFGTEGSLSVCYDYIVKAYHGYDQELLDKYTSRYKVCQVGKWSEKGKTAEVYLDTKAGKKKVYYTIVKLDDKNLVLVKR